MGIRGGGEGGGRREYSSGREGVFLQGVGAGGNIPSGIQGVSVDTLLSVSVVNYCKSLLFAGL